MCNTKSQQVCRQLLTVKVIKSHLKLCCKPSVKGEKDIRFPRHICSIIIIIMCWWPGLCGSSHQPSGCGTSLTSCANCRKQSRADYHFNICVCSNHNGVVSSQFQNLFTKSLLDQDTHLLPYLCRRNSTHAHTV